MTTWNTSDKHSQITLSGGNLTATVNAEPSNASGVRGSTSKSTGKHYFKGTVGVTGWLTFGLANSTAALGDRPGADNNNGICLASGGGGGSGSSFLLATNSFSNNITAGTISNSNVIWVAVDLDAKLVWVKIGSGNWNNNASYSPDAGTGGLSYTTTGALFPFYGGGYTNDALTVDFAPSSPPSGLSGFSTWDAASSHSFTADSLTVSSPVLGTPAISQAHVITVGTFADSSPVLGTPALFQNHVLTGTGITTSSPVLDTPAVTEFSGGYNLEANGIDVSSPVLGTPAIVQAHVITVGTFTDSSPVIGSPVIVQFHNFTASGFAVGSPVYTAVYLDGTAPTYNASYYATTLKLRLGI